ncbi:uncharacterized protein LOC126833441 [Adelges cooleyi]|uniref:uncharacterized protein LOC126833441 n=1 Tax=Adelges cooleyi TaxID=133065 RepID=UPI00217FF8E3|nr:uncharacterized protein LOC126833441 [Adelges cooleyi]
MENNLFILFPSTTSTVINKMDLKITVLLISHFLFVANSVLGMGAYTEEEILQLAYGDCQTMYGLEEHRTLTKKQFIAFVGDNDVNTEAVAAFFRTSNANREEENTINYVLFKNLVKEVCSANHTDVITFITTRWAEIDGSREQENTTENIVI